jgi:tetratricopeptide (TPR) repeat protein
VLDISTDGAVRQAAERNIARAEERLAELAKATPAVGTQAAPAQTVLASGTAPEATPAAAPPPATIAVLPAPPASPTLEAQLRQRARAAYEAGVKQVLAKDYLAALQTLTEAIALDSTLVVAFVARGSAQVGLKRYAEAADDYRRAMALDAGIASPLYGLAEAYRGLGRQEEARGLYEQYARSVASDARPELKAEARKKAGLPALPPAP